MNILLVKMGESMFNRSIWEGIARAFASLGHRVEVTDADAVAPASSGATWPDLLFVVHGGTVAVETIDRFREHDVVTAVYLLDEPYEVDRSIQWARHYDLVFSVDRATVPVHQAYSTSSFLPLGYDSERFHPRGRAYASDILVLGSPFEHRLQFLAPLRSRWGRYVTWVGPGWRPFCPQGRHVEQLVTPDICARFYRGANVVVNVHRDSFWSHYGEMNGGRLRATHLNPRFWEAAACGAFQLTSYRQDLERFFPSHASRESFETSDDLDALLERYWDAPDERQRLALEGTNALVSHSYRSRVHEVLSLIHPLDPAHQDRHLGSLHAEGKVI